MEKCSQRAILLMVGSFSSSSCDAGVRFWFTIGLSNRSGFSEVVPELFLGFCVTGRDCGQCLIAYQFSAMLRYN